MKIEELPIWSYLLDADRQIYIERRTLPGERESWAVKDGNYCLNKDGEWECQLPPVKTGGLQTATQDKTVD